ENRARRQETRGRGRIVLFKNICTAVVTLATPKHATPSRFDEVHLPASDSRRSAHPQSSGFTQHQEHVAGFAAYYGRDSAYRRVVCERRVVGVVGKLLNSIC